MKTLGIKLTGTPNRISKEEARALICATHSLLAFHNRVPVHTLKKIRIVPADHKKMEGVVGLAAYGEGTIYIQDSLSFSKFATVVIHEMIHFFLDCGNEWAVSTLTSHLKKEVIEMANIMVSKTYTRAAYIAHVKLSYDDYKKRKKYNRQEDHRRHEPSQGEKHRNKKVA